MSSTQAWPSRKAIYVKIATFLQSLPSEVQDTVHPTFKKILVADAKGEISQLSLVFSRSFSNDKSHTNKYLSFLGEANLLAWLAYTIYDDIIDIDCPPSSVSAANIVNQQSIKIYSSKLKNLDLILKYYSLTDKANTWETSYCRFIIAEESVQFSHIPSTKALQYMLSKRVSLHCLGPLALTLQSSSLSPHYAEIEKAFEYYCIARQLNDDLHDWVEDFKKGRMNYVVASLLKKNKIRPGRYNHGQLLFALKEQFYLSELESLCDEVINFIKKANNILNKLGFNSNENSLQNLYFEPIAHSAREAKLKHQVNKRALNTYIRVALNSL